MSTGLQQSAQITAASEEIEIAGEMLTASPITDRGWDELDNWLQSECVRTARNLMELEIEEAETRKEKMLAEEEGQALVNEAMKVATAVSFRSEIGQAMLRNVRGSSRLLYQMVRKNHPEIKHKDLIALYRKGDPHLCHITTYKTFLKFHAKIDETHEGEPGTESKNE